MNWIKSKIEEWGTDISVGVSYGSAASILKYMFQHFLDIFWSVTAMVIITVAHHYLKKWLNKRDKV